MIFHSSYKDIHSMPSNPMDEFIDELIICEQTNFIDTLIDDNVICRCDIFYNNDKNENSDWYFANTDCYDFEDLLTLLCEANITHTHFKQHIWIGITKRYSELFKDENWIKLYKLFNED